IGMPDLTVMDIQLPDLNGIEAVTRIRQAHPESRVLMLTMFDDDQSVFAAIKAGAIGYVLKGSSPEELLRSLGAVAAGEAIFSAAVAARMQRYFSAPDPSRATVFEELTPREHEVLSSVAQGLSNAEIARRLQLKPKTVRNHLSNIVSKLHVANRLEAAQRARERGLGG